MAKAGLANCEYSKQARSVNDKSVEKDCIFHGLHANTGVAEVCAAATEQPTTAHATSRRIRRLKGTGTFCTQKTLAERPCLKYKDLLVELQEKN
jgi:hypothetical protein